MYSKIIFTETSYFIALAEKYRYFWEKFILFTQKHSCLLSFKSSVFILDSMELSKTTHATLPLILVEIYRELDHESVHDAPHHRDEVERVPGVPEIALNCNKELFFLYFRRKYIFIYSMQLFIVHFYCVLWYSTLSLVYYCTIHYSLLYYKTHKMLYDLTLESTFYHYYPMSFLNLITTPKSTTVHAKTTFCTREEAAQ
jgi:hypothetical protein